MLTTSLEFFATLKWLDGRPLIDLIEPYRRHIFTAVLDTYEPDGMPKYDLALLSRAKKNHKTSRSNSSRSVLFAGSREPAGQFVFAARER